MYKYSISIVLLFLLVLGSFCPTAIAHEDACNPVEWISEIEGIKSSSTEMKAGKCERVYVFSNDVDLVFNPIKEDLRTEAGILKKTQKSIFRVLNRG